MSIAMTKWVAWSSLFSLGCTLQGPCSALALSPMRMASPSVAIIHPDGEAANSSPPFLASKSENNSTHASKANAPGTALLTASRKTVQSLRILLPELAASDPRVQLAGFTSHRRAKRGYPSHNMNPGTLRMDFGTKSVATRPLRNAILIGFLAVSFFGLWDWMRFWSLVHGSVPSSFLFTTPASKEPLPEPEPLTQSTQKPQEHEEPKWSRAGLVALTSYRFYTGFLSATWLPYLLAMEGADLYTLNQSSFMGIAKLIYGVTILFNPFFGLVGDRAVAVSHGIGRRLFLRAGVVMAGCGICICILADLHRYFYCFVGGIVLWRIGDAMTDVTTEALVPELVPAEQYAAASAAKATQFLLGGVCGYVLLIFMTSYHYTWLYWAYAIGMLVCSVPSQLLLGNDAPMSTPRRKMPQDGPFHETLAKAYLTPPKLEGYFPRVCLSIATFALGTSPMFFLLLMIRDLVGTTDPVVLNRNFSTSSIIFFISAAVATIVGGVIDQQRAAEESGDGSRNGGVSTILIKRLTTVVYVASAYAFVCLLLPTICLFESHATRITVFYFFAFLLGYCFGSGFARFQDITWQLIPADADVANAMGFNIMCRLFGVGIGNFAVGMMLDYFVIPQPTLSIDQSIDTGMLVKVYQPQGYVVMCCSCAIVCFLSSYLCSTIIAGVREIPVPAA